ncbi:hypothetical protein DERP_008373 [Dermatophagoides pteronyssinus]|uniref:Uncharacterized protein n=1 Tax=Dermatophagoides pteronyssinus TaxID=6956 RepID=A0ABQ8IV51_DERPT|nr:hypothetical protein DERP_008373 [Dermatophagoides pteronyssinus]
MSVLLLIFLIRCIRKQKTEHFNNNIHLIHDMMIDWIKIVQFNPAALFRTIRLILDTDGILSASQIPSANKRSPIASTTFGVATFGFDPPITPGFILPVS